MAVLLEWFLSCCSYSNSSWSFRCSNEIRDWGRDVPPPPNIACGCCEPEHISPITGKDKECMELWLHSTLCHHYHTSALVALSFILKLQECVQYCYASIWSSLFQVLRREAFMWCKMLKICLCCGLFVHSWVQGKGTHHHDLDQMWCLRGASDAVQKYVSKINFHSVAFTFIVNGPFRKVKSGFHHVSLLASSMDKWWTMS